MNEIGGWEKLRPIGEGGQSQVLLVRSPERVQQRKKAAQKIAASMVAQRTVLGRMELAEQVVPEFAQAIADFTRADLPFELGALKLFNKLRDGGSEAEQQSLKRLINEIRVLSERRPGLIRLLESNERERWIVTEYYPGGALDKHPTLFQGNLDLALAAFRTIVETVTSLHNDKIVHRDIKPANVFIAADNSLVLGDFGIAFLPDQTERLTLTQERVGPRDYMPQWGDLGIRLENVHTNFDVYMLGKLLWCMLSGKLKLPREWHRRPQFNLALQFSNDPRMEQINLILDRCLVDDPDHSVSSAGNLLEIVDQAMEQMKSSSPRVDASGKLTLPCRVCGKGRYIPRDEELRIPNTTNHPTFARMYVCNVCCHFEFFCPGNPEEAFRRNWKPWSQ